MQFFYVMAALDVLHISCSFFIASQLESNGRSFSKWSRPIAGLNTGRVDLLRNKMFKINIV